MPKFHTKNPPFSQKEKWVLWSFGGANNLFLAFWKVGQIREVWKFGYWGIGIRKREGHSKVVLSRFFFYFLNWFWSTKGFFAISDHSHLITSESCTKWGAKIPFLLVWYLFYVHKVEEIGIRVFWSAKKILLPLCFIKT